MTIKTNLPNLKCHSCGHEGSDYAVKEQGDHLRAECGSCVKYIKFISQDNKYGTKEQREQIWNKTLGRCCYCGIPLNPFKKNGYSYEHMTSQHNGGGHEVENLYSCCKSCNSSKGKKSLTEYRKYKLEQHEAKTHVFFFEIMLYSEYGFNLKHYNTIKFFGDD